MFFAFTAFTNGDNHLSILQLWVKDVGRKTFTLPAFACGGLTRVHERPHHKRHISRSSILNVAILIIDCTLLRHYLCFLLNTYLSSTLIDAVKAVKENTPLCSVARAWARAKDAKEVKYFSSEVVLRSSEINQTTSELNLSLSLTGFIFISTLHKPMLECRGMRL